ncbi:SulP family inorganic anion transporter [Nonomuraea sp. NPDC049400]|uniref:SulP family inorganic anion transporter n=1 Tax=Nonomuraea sp. NPDC049400 TaxID=3364352 RepID=UPI00379C5ABC
MTTRPGRTVRTSWASTRWTATACASSACPAAPARSPPSPSSRSTTAARPGCCSAARRRISPVTARTTSSPSHAAPTPTRIPAPLLAVLLATACVTLLGLERYGIKVVGAIPAGLPMPALPAPDDLRHLLLPALGVLLVGYSDNMLTARSFAAKHDQQIDANRELLALGVANLGAGVLHGFPVSSSGSRTALADAAGGRSQVYSLVALAAILSVVFFAGPLLADFPMAALGAIVIYAATRLIDVAAFRRLAAFRRSELLLAARPHDAILGVVPGLAGMHDVDDYPAARTIPGLVIYRYDSPLFFANAQDFRRAARLPRSTSTRALCRGSCSTSKPMWRWTPRLWTRWSRSAPN